ncbi:MAG: J domain-containing protein [bacterium]
MNIFSRLIEIISANLSYYDADSRIQDDYDRQEFFEDLKNNETHEHWQAQQKRLDYDPELAGYYANLEVPYGSDLTTVKKSWKRLVRKFHPDLHSTDPKKRQLANDLTRGLNRAYESIVKKLENRDVKT